MSEPEEDGWWPEPIDTIPVHATEFMDLELNLNSDKVKLRAGESVRIMINHWDQEGIRFRPDKPCYIKLTLVNKP